MLHAYYSSDAYIYSLPYIHDSQKITPYYARLVSTFWSDFPTLCYIFQWKVFFPDWLKRTSYFPQFVSCLLSLFFLAKQKELSKLSRAFIFYVEDTHQHWPCRGIRTLTTVQADCSFNIFSQYSLYPQNPAALVYMAASIPLEAGA